MGERASAFASRLPKRFTIRLFHRTPGKVRSIARLLHALLRFQPDICYVYDMAFSGVLSAGLCKHLTGCKVIVDTGDAIVDLARSMGRGPAGRLLTWLLEGYSLRMADRIVVRGRFHQQLLARAASGPTSSPMGSALMLLSLLHPRHAYQARCGSG